MISIRLKRVGRKKNPFFHIVAAEKNSPINGKFIEKLGYYNPKNKKDSKINNEKITKWIECGAKISERIKNIIKKNINNND